MSDYFELFGMPRTFALDEKALQQKYLELQRAFHPDRAQAEQKLAMLQKSADINQAYNTLKNPVSRAEYLLSVQEKPSQEMLMEAMEQRESLAEADSPSVLKKLQLETERAIQECIKKLGYALDAQTVLRLKYLTKFVEEIRVKSLEMS